MDKLGISASVHMRPYFTAVKSSIGSPRKGEDGVEGTGFLARATREKFVSQTLRCTFTTLLFLVPREREVGSARGTLTIAPKPSPYFPPAPTHPACAAYGRTIRPDFDPSARIWFISRMHWHLCGLAPPGERTDRGTAPDTTETLWSHHSPRIRRAAGG